MTKRLVCFALLLSVAFCFCACKNSKSENTKGVDVEYYANLGQIPECEFALGKNSKDIISELGKKKNEENESTEESTGYIVNEKDDETVISVDNCDYICDKKENKVSKIVCFGDSYGFENGTISIEVKESLSSYGFDGEEKAITEEQQKLFHVGSDCTVLQYKFEKSTVIFAFQDNALLGTAIFR